MNRKQNICIEQTLIHVGWLKVFVGYKRISSYRFVSCCPQELKREMEIQRIGFEQKGLSSEIMRIITTTIKDYLHNDAFYLNIDEIEIVLLTSNSSLSFHKIFSIGNQVDNGNDMQAIY